MAFFKFRKGGDDVAAATAPAESVEVMRKRARHRLLGAAVLVLIGVVGFPLLFETQPRSTASDIPIEIPDRNKVKPLTLPAASVSPAASAVAETTVTPAVPAVSVAPVVVPTPALPVVAVPAATAARPASAASTSHVAANASLAAHEEVLPSKKDAKPEAKAVPAPAAAAGSGAAVTKSAPPVVTDEGAKAQALLDGKTPPASSAAAPEARFVVQVGAFAENTKARDARQKLEKAGFKTYVQVVDTKDGKRTRVRAGPFATKAEADKAAARIKTLDLHAAVLTL